MAAKTLNDFALSGVAAADDYLVGFDTATAGGERKWTVSTIANAVSGIMTAQLNNTYLTSASLTGLDSTIKAYVSWIESSTGVITIGRNYNISSITRINENIRRITFNNLIVGSYSGTIGFKLQTETPDGYLYSYAPQFQPINSQYANLSFYRYQDTLGATYYAVLIF